MDFALDEEQLRIQKVCQELAADFKQRAAKHDEEASAPEENYVAIKEAGLLGLGIPQEFGGLGGLLTYVIAAEELAQGCASTALSFNMHPADLNLLFMPGLFARETQQHIADLAIQGRNLFAGMISEPSTTGRLPMTFACSTKAKRVDGGWLLNGQKMFASMIESADYACLYVHPEEEPDPQAAYLVLLPVNTPGYRVDNIWDTVGMRATRSNRVVFDDTFVPSECVIDERLLNVGEFLKNFVPPFDLPYTAVYLGVGVAALKAAIAAAHERVPKGFRQSYAFHPDIRRRIGIMAAELEAARGLVRLTAWLLDTEGCTKRALSTFYQAKYFTGQTVANATRSALEIAGAHGIFKGSEVERLFRDGATSTIMYPPSDLCSDSAGIIELGLEFGDLCLPLEKADTNLI